MPGTRSRARRAAGGNETCQNAGKPAKNASPGPPKITSGRKRKLPERESSASARNKGARKKVKVADSRVSSESSVTPKPKPLKSIAFFDLANPNAYWVHPRYSGLTALKKNILVCQLCTKSFIEVPDAIRCLQSHGEGRADVIRCYLCFKVFIDSESEADDSASTQLFAHYRDEVDHEQGGRPSSLKCPYCNANVAYNSVSTHIVANHMTQDLLKEAREYLECAQKKKDKKGSTNEQDNPLYKKIVSINPDRFRSCDCAN